MKELSSKEIGNNGENIACGYLINKGWEILEKNYRFKRFEIDIICKNLEILSFVEVKIRKTNNYGFPETFVSEKQKKQIMIAAEEYTFQNNYMGDIRFDIISITVNPFEIMLIEDAF